MTQLQHFTFKMCASELMSSANFFQLKKIPRCTKLSRTIYFLPRNKTRMHHRRSKGYTEVGLQVVHFSTKHEKMSPNVELADVLRTFFNAW